MNAVSGWLSTFGQAAADALADAGRYLPSLIAAILILVVGWITAKLARKVVCRLCQRANQVFDSALQRHSLSRLRISSATATALGQVAFWTILFLTVTISAYVARFDQVAVWLNDIAFLLPNLFLGAAIIVVGYIASLVVGEQISSTAIEARSQDGEFAGRLAQTAIFVGAIIIGLGQIGIDVTLLIVLVSVVAGAMVSGMFLAFGLGSRNYVSNLVGARTARKVLREGLIVRIGATQGEILEITPTQIALDTANGRALIPARLVDRI
jgi:hypothetical protein